MQASCPDSKPLFLATLPNYSVIFTGWSREWRGGKATIKSYRGGKVRGAVYDISEVCVRKLDKTEAGYGRLNVTVFDEDNESVPAVTYIKSGYLEESLPSKQYGEVIRQGYRDWGIA